MKKEGIPLKGIVGIGASAGGLEAYQDFFQNLSPATNFCFVLVQHLDPTRESMLVELIQRYTRMKVVQALDGMELKPNEVVVIPPNRELGILGGRVQLIEPTAPRAMRRPIDFFLRSLAQDFTEKATAVILSGTGSDGSRGIVAIKEEGGHVFVQDPEDARYDGMPRSAIQTKAVDSIQSTRDLAAYFSSQEFGEQNSEVEVDDAISNRWLQKIFLRIRSKIGYDFSHYKFNTINRRIKRRMQANQVEDWASYHSILQDKPDEIHKLFRELLIGVTNFFRDPKAFEILKKEVIEPLVMRDSHTDKIRVWVPGCSSGEEAYTIAMLIQSVMEEKNQLKQVQVFASDIDTNRIEQARAGLYSKTIASDVPESYLKSYFQWTSDGYQIHRSIREMVVFANQNLISDPPFTKLDLISCRNLLIYLDGVLHQRVFPLFHYSLNTGGHLFLGVSESIGSFEELFTPVNAKYRLFQRKEASRSKFRLRISPPTSKDPEGVPSVESSSLYKRGLNYQQVANHVLLSKFAPPAVLVDEDLDIIYLQGDCNHYLKLSTGMANLNLSRMLKMELKAGVLNLIRKVQKENLELGKETLHVMLGSQLEHVQVNVIPLEKPGSFRGLYLVVFESIKTHAVIGNEYDPKEIESNEVARLESELRETREYLQTTIEELETTNEEITSTNEELQSANEELQSTNEELETSTEELNSVNEELNSVNLELERKVQELSEVNMDMLNLVDNSNLGVIILDSQLRIRRFTRAATEIFNLIPTDIERPFRHITADTNYSTLNQDVMEVLKTRNSSQKFVKSHNDVWYQLEIKPYQESEFLVRGVMITITNISVQKELENKIVKINTNQQLYHFHSKLLHLIMDEHFNIEIANPAMDRLLKGKSIGTNFLMIFSLKGDDFRRVSRGLKSLLKKPSGSVYSCHWKYNHMEIHFEFHTEKSLKNSSVKISGLGMQRKI